MNDNQNRTRRTTGEKKFTCGGCKKQYYSYPAIYTHVRNKHDGVFPKDTILGDGLKPLSVRQIFLNIDEGCLKGRA